VIALAQARGYEVIERAVMPEELAKTQEVFLTGTAVEVTPVSEIDDYKFTPGDITRELLTAYDELVQQPGLAASAA
jgi:branched-chain amino acid aminotransferase